MISEIRKMTWLLALFLRDLSKIFRILSRLLWALPIIQIFYRPVLVFLYLFLWVFCHTIDCWVVVLYFLMKILMFFAYFKKIILLPNVFYIVDNLDLIQLILFLVFCLNFYIFWFFFNEIILAHMDLTYLDLLQQELMFYA